MLHRPQKQNKKTDYSDKSTTGSTSTSVFFFLPTIFGNSAVTPVSPLIRKSTTLWSTLWCFHYSMAKRQQFLCPVGTANLSLRYQVVGFVLSRTVAKHFFHCSSIDRAYEYVSKNLARCNVFFASSTAVAALKQCLFLSTFLCFLRHVSSRLRRRWHESIGPPPLNTFLVCIHENTVNLRRFH